MAEAEISRGQDPSKSLQAAIAAFRRAVVPEPGHRLDPQQPGQHLSHAGRVPAGPRAPIRGARCSRRWQATARTLAIRPDYAYGPYNLAYTYRLLAQALQDRGEDPAPALASARSWIEASLKINPDDADTFLERGRVERIAARPEAAGTALDRAEALNPASPEIYLEQALLERWRAEAGIQPAEAVRRGLERAERALAINAKDPRALAVRGALLRLAGQSAQADASLREALALNPLLRREYGPLLSR